MAKIEETLGEYMESLAGLIESMSEDTRTRMAALDEQHRRATETLDRLASVISNQGEKLAALDESLKAIQQLMEAELARLADGVEGHREAVLGAMIETRDRIHEAELAVLDAYVLRPKSSPEA